ncbi:MAG: ATP-binding protein [Oligoflexia bacterium]|nr:ATP-binding protein [Oligoflexia bacterium]
MERYLHKALRADFTSKKILIISGPRQSGKTTLARSLSDNHVYLNWDDPEHRGAILKRDWDREPPLLVLDELHKMPRWKSWLKGLYDTARSAQTIVVTGSARIDTFRRVGDSLAGRYFHFRLHPIDAKEAKMFAAIPGATSIERILQVGGFPEPFLKGSPQFYRRWSRTHTDMILKQDLIDLEVIANVQMMILLIERLRHAVGSPISIHAIAEDLQVSDKAIRRWLGLLEELYVIFRLGTYHRNVARSIHKPSKYYFYDSARITDAGARFENLVANALKKEIDYRNDCLGEDYDLFMLRDRDQKEIDFLITKNQQPHLMIEAKSSDPTPARAFAIFAQRAKVSRAIQVVRELDRTREYDSGLRIVPASKWLETLRME